MDDGDEPLVIEIFENTGLVHIDHCARCHLQSCPFESGFGCPIIPCQQCAIQMHECKMAEHLQDICPKTKIHCINAANGCTKMMRRFRLSIHLENCPANIVVCTREWARKTVSNDSKLRLKATAKGLLPWEGIGVSEEELDLAAAHSDQKVLFDSYTFRRKHRVNQRDRIHRNHPLVPLREVFNSMEQAEEPGGHEVEGDSSEEEREAKAALLRSKKAMFANCYMCQVDPASQHLHTLGNESSKFKLGRPVKKWPNQVDKFHPKHSLMIDFSTVSTFEDKNRLFRKTLYIRRCLRVFHRREIAEHELSQHQTGLDSLDQLVVRCPNWERGCDFFTSRLKPLEGFLRFSRVLDSVCHCLVSSTSKPQANGGSLEDQPDWVIQCIADYLPSSALFALSLTSRKMRGILIEALEDCHLVELKWRKTKEGWKEDGFKSSFSTADRPTKLIWQPAVGLAEHLANCSFGEKKTVSEKRVLVLIDRFP